MKGLKFLGTIIFFMVKVAWSDDVEVKGVILQPTLAHQKVPLMAVQLSPAAKRYYLQRLQKTSIQPPLKSSGLSSVQLGMENVPVLNQGIHGSCVIFAAAAAVDAILKKGDHVSPLCSLQLGRYLQSFGYLQSGWDGALAHSVLSQLEAFGFLSKDYQYQEGCGGLYEYPLLDRQFGSEMSLTTFHPESESLLEHRIGWSSILDVYQSSHEPVDMQGLLSHVKAVLTKGDRAIIGVLLAEPELGLAGAVGTYHTLNDTWLLTPEIQQDMKQNPQYAGHALLVTGFDDNAYAKDDFGRIHRGLITLRNSWGDKIGDHGNFYMSYDYFKAMVMEIQRIRQLNSEQ
ncbi:MAG: Peptidase [Pseudomonadota bacterium]|nr:Peptidase [Pseudomonadota bacterium]